MRKIYPTLLALLISGASLAQAPELVLDINDGSSGSNPRNLFVFNNLLFFAADDSSGVNSGGADTGIEPWTTDGTAAGTNLLQDINPGEGNSSSPFNVFEFNGALYFTANDGAAELWTSDLGAGGTSKVDLFPDVDGDVPNNAVVFGNNVYLTANLASGNNQVVEWDGTNPAQIAPNAAGSDVATMASSFVVYNDLLYGYIENNVDEPTTGRELYSYNPDTDTYTLIKDIASGNSNSGISNFTVANGLLYFEAEGNLWQSDGTTANTIEVPQNAALGMNGVNNLFNYNENILFEGDNGGGDQLWILNTTTGTISQISNTVGDNDNHDPSDFVELNGFVYYRGESGSSTNGVLFRTDGVTIFQLDDTIKDVDDVTVYNGLIYFEGEDVNASLGNELYVYDPATASIDRVANKAITMYPNPSKDGIITFANNVNAQDNFKVNDLSGREVLTGKLNNNQLTHDLKTGVYFISLESVDSVFKVVVE
jgi:ELWxxDGT repeat protein